MLSSGQNLRVILEALPSHTLGLTYPENPVGPIFHTPQSRPPLSTSTAAGPGQPTGITRLFGPAFSPVAVLTVATRGTQLKTKSAHVPPQLGTLPGPPPHSR